MKWTLTNNVTLLFQTLAHHHGNHTDCIYRGMCILNFLYKMTSLHFWIGAMCDPPLCKPALTVWLHCGWLEQHDSEHAAMAHDLEHVLSFLHVLPVTWHKCFLFKHRATPQKSWHYAVCVACGYDTSPVSAAAFGKGAASVVTLTWFALQKLTRRRSACWRSWRTGALALSSRSCVSSLSWGVRSPQSPLLVPSSSGSRSVWTPSSSPTPSLSTFLWPGRCMLFFFLFLFFPAKYSVKRCLDFDWEFWRHVGSPPISQCLALAWRVCFLELLCAILSGLHWSIATNKPPMPGFHPCWSSSEVTVFFSYKIR